MSTTSRQIAKTQSADKQPDALATSTPNTVPIATTTPRQEFRRGLMATAPLLIVVLPYGLIYGALGVAAGMSPAAVAAMSATVFAGAAQFLAVGLYAAQTPPSAIVLATLIVNLRHLLYAVALGRHYRRLPRYLLLPLAFTTIDEVFILTQARVQRTTGEPGQTTRHLHWFALGVGTFLYVGWQLATWVGIGGGQLIQDPTTLGLDFALPAMFIAFLVPQLHRHPVIVCALISGVSAIALRELPMQTGLILAILLGVMAALLAETVGGKQKSGGKNTNDEEATP
jgi:4-azaleucine resistance transporter AzlC